MPISAALPPRTERLRQSFIHLADTGAPSEVRTWFLIAKLAELPLEDPVLIRIKDLGRDFTVDGVTVSALAA